MKKPRQKRKPPEDKQKTVICPQCKKPHVVDDLRGWFLVIRKIHPETCRECEDK